MPDLGKLGLKFENAAVIFEISTFEVMKSEILINTVNLVTGVAYLYAREIDKYVQQR